MALGRPIALRLGLATACAVLCLCLAGASAAAWDDGRYFYTYVDGIRMPIAATSLLHRLNEGQPDAG